MSPIGGMAMIWNGQHLGMVLGICTGLRYLHGLQVWVLMGMGMGHTWGTCDPCLVPITKQGAQAATY
jgi:hypothetical protein